MANRLTKGIVKRDEVGGHRNIVKYPAKTEKWVGDSTFKKKNGKYFARISEVIEPHKNARLTGNGETSVKEIRSKRLAQIRKFQAKEFEVDSLINESPINLDPELEAWLDEMDALYNSGAEICK